MDEAKIGPWAAHRAKYNCQCTRSTGSCQKPKKLEAEKQAAALSGFDLEKLGATIAAGVVAGMKAAETEKTRERDALRDRGRKRMQAQLRETREAEILKWKRCSHMRAHPYSGTSRIAWATQSDGLTRGTCMGCGCPFSPVTSDLPDPVAMKGWYEKMIAVPQTVAANDFLQGTVMAGSPA